MLRREKGFTLIELLIVVAIIGIIAAIAVPNLLTAIQRSKQKRSMADMRAIGTALGSYQTDYDKYPTAAGGNFTTTTWGADASVGASYYSGSLKDSAASGRHGRLSRISSVTWLRFKFSSRIRSAEIPDFRISLRISRNGCPEPTSLSRYAPIIIR